jgi:hypothetical protein
VHIPFYNPSSLPLIHRPNPLSLFQSPDYYHFTLYLLIWTEK